MEVYARPFDEKRPVICMDEKPFQLLDDFLEPIWMSKENHVMKYDCEYVRKGSCSIFMFTEPLGGWREAHALPRRTAVDWAHELKWLIDEKYSKAEKIVLVMDNLNTHAISSFYKAFSPEEAFRLAQKLEIHYTPKHGSWLDIAEFELSALTIQCLQNVRISSIDALNDITIITLCRGRIFERIVPEYIKIFNNIFRIEQPSSRAILFFWLGSNAVIT